MKPKKIMYKITALIALALACLTPQVSGQNTPEAAAAQNTSTGIRDGLMGVVDPAAIVVTGGQPDILWKPQPFHFEAAGTTRYIDYENGSDQNPGSKNAPWKHHPWDSNATGKAAQAETIDTYVFKGGVVYRGTLVADESGTTENPIRLTRDPKWGDGEAVISGAEPIGGFRPYRASADARVAPASAKPRRDPSTTAPAGGDPGLLPALQGKDNGVPEGWELFKPWMSGNIQVKTENGQKIIRLTGRAILNFYRDIPADAKTLTLSGSARVANFEQGANAWDDMRVGLAYRDAQGEPIGKPWKNDVILRADQGWTAFQQEHPIPAGAVKLDVYITHKADAGTLDVSGLSLTIGSAESQSNTGASTTSPPSRTGFPDRAEAPDLPAPPLSFPESVRDRILVADLPAGVEPRFLWTTGDQSDLTLTVAREPDWSIDDMYHWDENWWHWTSAKKNGLNMRMADPENLTDPDPQAYVGATVWTDVPNQTFQIHTPMSHPVQKYNPDKGELSFRIRHPRRAPREGSPYYLSNLPRFLDEPGEWYARDGKVYLLPEAGTDPSRLRLEAAARNVLIDIANQSHIHLSGLTFVHANIPDPNRAPNVSGPGKPWLSFEIGAIQLRGSVEDISVTQCVFIDLPLAIMGFPLIEGDRMDQLRFNDNLMERLDDGGIKLTGGIVWKPKAPMGWFDRVEVLRNKMSDIGLGYGVGQVLRGVHLNSVARAHVAGNVIERVGGPGIDVWNGRAGGGRETQVDKQPGFPLVRGFIHHNKVSDSLMRIADYGGIESWGGGPSYVFSNISARPVGYMPTNGWYHKNHAFYFDHQYKGYLFNNIGWGIDYDRAWKGVMSQSFFQQAHGFLTYAFHNTADNFRTFHTAGLTQANARNRLIGNLVIEPAEMFTQHIGVKKNDPELETIAYANNLIVGETTEIYGTYPKDDITMTLDATRKKLQGDKAMVPEVGNQVRATAVVSDSATQRYEPTAASPAIDGGAKVFVPWGLYETVGEWNFHAYPAFPEIIVGESFWQTREHKNARKYHELPRGDLRVEEASLGDYQYGALETWTKSALRFDGKRVARATAPAGFPGTDLDMDTNNFLIEAVFQPADGTGGGILAEKMGSEAGYRLMLNDDASAIRLVLKSGNEQAEIVAPLGNTGAGWHHVLAEVDRAAEKVTVYVDGAEVASEALTLPTSASFANNAEFTVGDGFVGLLDFLRVSRGTLADADTTFDELYTWQFFGPQNRDFAGRPVNGRSRDIGALESNSRL